MNDADGGWIVVLWVALALILMALVLDFAPIPPMLGIPGNALAEMAAWLGLVLFRVDSYRRAPARYRRFRLLVDAPFFSGHPLRQTATRRRLVPRWTGRNPSTNPHGYTGGARTRTGE